MRMISLFSLIVLVFVSAPEAADLYRFAEEDGNVYYTNISGEGRVKIPLTSMKTDNPPSPPFRKGGLGGFDGHFLNERERYEPIITSVSQRFTLDPDLIRAVIKAESNFNPRAISPKGAMGLMQLMPQTAREMGVSNPFDPLQNIHAGVRYLDQLLKAFNQNLPFTLAAYNAGPTRVFSENGIPSIEETRNYVQRVMRYFNEFKKTSKNISS